MWEATSEDQLAEIAFIGDEDALFSLCDCHHVAVSQSARVIVDNTRDAVAHVCGVRSEREVGALVEKELQPLARSLCGA